MASTKTSHRKKPNARASTRRESTSSDAFDPYRKYADLDFYYESEESLRERISRTSFILLDYKQFKAARTIQRIVRGFLVRRRLKLAICAAIIIQREWRRYHAQRNYFRILEERVQEAIEAHHYRAAVRIQAFWRGFFVREHIHDQFRMKRWQRMAAEDLMHCVAVKLHYLLRTYQIPGVYSLRNSHALSKIEKLLTSISFRQDNRQSFVARIQRTAELKDSRKLHQKSTFGTKIPYTGPNYSGACDTACTQLNKEPNIDARLHQILRKYEQEELKQKLKHKLTDKKPAVRKLRLPKDPRDFCSDVIQSMHRWNIVANDSFEVRSDIFKNPASVEGFLAEISSLYDFMYNPCYCESNKPSRHVS